jgi:hypothetical protein
MKLPCESAKQNHRPQGGLVQQFVNVMRANVQYERAVSSSNPANLIS